jgi:hypothetical protein
MNDPFVLFLAVAAVWFVLRIVIRRWAEQRVASGDLSIRDLFVINASTWALLPLLAIPLVTFPGGRELLALLAVVGFAFQLVLWLLLQRFGGRS